jgi:HAMP domain-containing protein
MDDFFKMDVFFVTTTAVVVAGGVLVIIALFYVVRILRSLDNVMKNVSAESTDIRGDIATLRAKVREEGMKMKHVGDFLASIASRRGKAKAKHKHAAHDPQ